LVNSKINKCFDAGATEVVAPIKKININGSDFTLPKYDENTLMN